MRKLFNVIGKEILKVTEGIPKKKEISPKEINMDTKNIYQGIKIENDPLEREIYAKCPLCTYKVFDSGLSNEL